MSDTVKIAAVQIDIQLGKVETNLARILAYAGEAAGNGANVVVFPECALTGYGFNSREEAIPAAQSVPGPATDAVSTLCSALGIHVIFGMLELYDASLYNTAVLIGPGSLIFKYRKNHLPFQGVDRFLDKGNVPFQLCKAGDLRIGLQICYDLFFPESSRVHSLLGADLVALPTNLATKGGVEGAGFVVNTRALENKVYFLSCNRVGEERGYLFCGRSKIAAPNGLTLAEASTDREEIIYAEIDPEKARRKRTVLSAGKWEVDLIADRRPELYGILTESIKETR